MAQHNELGIAGERLAREYLLKQGYAIGGENIVICGVELDFIAIKDNRIAFVEVKTRSSDFTDPLDAVDHKKQCRLARAADRYIRIYNIPREPQFDIITVIGDPVNNVAGCRLTHYADAFRPPLMSR